jgi:hypothetical protein
MKSSGQASGNDETSKASLPPSDAMRSDPADPANLGRTAQVQGRVGVILLALGLPPEIEPNYLEPNQRWSRIEPRFLGSSSFAKRP